MNQGTTFILVMTGLLIVFYIMGILPEGSINGQLLTILAHPEDMFNGGHFWTVLLTYLGTLTAVGITLNWITGGNSDLVFMIPLVSYLVILLTDFLQVYNAIRQANPVIALLLSPILFIWVITMIELIRGRD